MCSQALKRQMVNQQAHYSESFVLGDIGGCEKRFDVIYASLSYQLIFCIEFARALINRKSRSPVFKAVMWFQRCPYMSKQGVYAIVSQFIPTSISSHRQNFTQFHNRIIHTRMRFHPRTSRIQKLFMMQRVPLTRLLIGCRLFIDQ